ncbi:MAG: hypothetical protein R3B82_06935 [Sandaracinaceae bacterium]
MRETRLESVLALRSGGLPAPTAAYLVARVAELVDGHPRQVSLPDVRVRADGGVRLALRDRPVPFDYRAPEVAQGAGGDPRAAVFSLGVLLVHTALGRSPFARETDLETRLAVGEEDVPALVGRAGQASAELDVVVARACAKDPFARYASPAALRDALDGYLEDELHVVGPKVLATAVREAIERAPSDDRTSMPDYEDAELALAPAPSRHAPETAHFEDGFVRLGDPLATGGEAGITEASMTGVRESGPKIRRPAHLDVDVDVIEAEKEARNARTRAPEVATAPASSPNWMLRIGGALLVLLLAAIVYQFLVRPLFAN